MNTENTRVTREEAAALAGVTPRTISRWRARGRLTVRRDRSFRKPATYDAAEVLRAAGKVPETGDEQSTQSEISTG